jgi:hypothetical protein
MIPGGYNQNVQLVQTRDYVVIHNEMNHNARIVPLDGRPRLPDHIRPWNGDSRGKWEGDTLVVTTTNFKSIGTGTLMLDGNRAALGIGWSPDENLTLTERFTRLDRDRMTYEWTMNDLTIWTKPWTVRMPLTRIDSNIFEYACHEGNHDFGFILAGQRKIEREGIKPAPKPVPGAKPR